MAISITDSDFTFEPNINPGDGLQYLYYFANQPGGYTVSVLGASNGYDDSFTQYYVFAIGDDTGTASDNITTLNTGTFEGREGDDIFFNASTLLFRSTASQPVRFFGGNGNDQFNILAGSGYTSYDDVGATWVFGGSGNDIINGGNDVDVLYGDQTNSFLFSPGVNPTTPPPYGDVVLADFDTSRDGDDILAGYDGNDELYGNGGADQLYGGDGADILDGGLGSDFLYGGPRGAGFQDLLTGGGDADAFLLSYNQESSSSSFWSYFFEQLGIDVAQASLRGAFQNKIKTTTTTNAPIETGFLAATLAVVFPEVGSLAGLFCRPCGRSIRESNASGRGFDVDH